MNESRLLEIQSAEQENETDQILLSFNWNSINNAAKAQLERFILDITKIQKPVAILLQETKHSTNKMINIKIKGYRIIKTTSTSQENNRGSMILVSNECNAIPLGDRSESNVELIGIEIYGNNKTAYKKPLEVWNLYSGPNLTDSKITSKLLDQYEFTNKKKDYLIAGDFNCNLIPGTKTAALKLREKIEDWQENGLIKYDNECTPIMMIPPHFK